MTEYAKRLAGLDLYGLANAYQITSEAAKAAPSGSRAATIQINRREAVAAEVSRRGRVIRRHYSGGFIALTHEEARTWPL